VSQSPLDSDAPFDQSSYLDGWDSLAELIRSGHSFSGRERNCAFLNLGERGRDAEGSFADVSSAIGLDLIDDGRGMAVVDWDLDGDLDLWLANRTGPRVRLMRNDSCPGSSHVTFELRGTKSNRDAIGARVELITNDGRMHVRTVRAGDGFLSQSSKRIHFGLPTEVEIEEVRVRWPGTRTPVSFRDIVANGRYRLVEGDVGVQRLPTRSEVPLTAKPLGKRATASDASRTVLSQRLAWPRGETSQRLEQSDGRLTLAVLWASWCEPCLAELADLAGHHDALSNAGVDIVTINSDEKRAEADAAISSTRLPFDVRFASDELMESLSELDNVVFYRKRPLPLPCSFLIDEEKKIAVIYKGRVGFQQVIDDADRMKRSSAEIVESGLPFPGRRIAQWFSPGRVNVARAYLESGYLEDAKRELRAELARPTGPASRERALRLFLEIATIEKDVAYQSELLAVLRELRPSDLSIPLRQILIAAQKDGPSIAMKQLDELVDRSTGRSDDLVRIAQAYGRIGNALRAIELLEDIVAADPENSETRMNLALAYQITGKKKSAIREYREVVKLDPQRTDAMNNLAWLLAESDPRESLHVARRVCELTGNANPTYLDTLALALISNGEAAEARRVLRRGISIARGRSETELMQKMMDRLAGLSS